MLRSIFQICTLTNLFKYVYTHVCTLLYLSLYMFLCVCLCICASDFGFNLSSFSGIERGESHRVKVMFFSGGIDSGIILIIRLDLSGTASKCDSVIARL